MPGPSDHQPLYDLLKRNTTSDHLVPPLFFPFPSSTIVNRASNFTLCRRPCKLTPRSLAQLISYNTSVTRPQPAPITVSDVPTLFLAPSEQEAQRFLLNRNVNVQRSCLPLRSGVSSSFTTLLQRSTFLPSKVSATWRVLLLLLLIPFPWRRTPFSPPARRITFDHSFYCQEPQSTADLEPDNFVDTHYYILFYPPAQEAFSFSSAVSHLRRSINKILIRSLNQT